MEIVVHIIELAEIIGVLSFSLSGFLIAIESKLDLLGIFISSFLTALGGGVIRDVIVGKDLYAFENNFASLLVIFVVLIGILLKIKNCSCVEKHPLFVISDTNIKIDKNTCYRYLKVVVYILNTECFKLNCNNQNKRFHSVPQ